MRTSKEEIKTLIIMIKSIYQHWDVNSHLVNIWTAVLGRYDVQTLNNAIRFYLSTDHEFPPKPGQLVEICEKMTLCNLNQPAAMALADSSALAQVAMEKAQRACPFNDKAQYQTVEDLQTAQRINANRVHKLFEANYASLRDTALNFMRFSECSEEKAIQMTLENQGIKTLTTPLNVLTLVKNVADGKEKTQSA